MKFTKFRITIDVIVSLMLVVNVNLILFCTDLEDLEEPNICRFPNGIFITPSRVESSFRFLSEDEIDCN